MLALAPTPVAPSDERSVVRVAAVDMCALDRLALEALGEIRRLPSVHTNESFSVIYRAADGRLARTPVRTGRANRITSRQVASALDEAGIEFHRLIAFVHNHPAHSYAFDQAEVALNRYPSGGEAEGDWRFTRWLAERGAGDGGNALFLYVIDPRRQLRRFAFADRDVYLGLSLGERTRGKALPGPIAPESLHKVCRSQRAG